MQSIECLLTKVITYKGQIYPSDLDLNTEVFL